MSGVSESWGTLRFGRLAEVLLYDVRRTCTLAGPSAVYIDPEVESWLLARAASPEVTHLVHAPSSPMGWSAGKWMEWYPDVLDPGGKLTTAKPKPYWQSGWLKQHDRLVASMAAMKGRIPLTVSGDLHAIGIGKILRAGTLDIWKEPAHRCSVWPHRHRALGLAIRAAWGRRLPGVSRRERRDQAHRAARLHDRRFSAGRIVLRFFRMGPEDANAGRD